MSVQVQWLNANEEEPWGPDTDQGLPVRLSLAIWTDFNCSTYTKVGAGGKTRLLPRRTDMLYCSITKPANASDDFSFW